jgi:serine protease
LSNRRLQRVALTCILAAAVPRPSSAEDDRYIVQFRPGRALAGRAALRAAGARIALALDPQEAVAARLGAGTVARLRRNPNVEYVEADPVREPLALWSDVSLGGEMLPYGIQMVQADLVTGTDAGNRKVCIIDSGYSQQHDDLKDQATGEVTFDADAGSGTWDRDSCGHGTHVAGTVAAIAGNGTGVVGANPGVRLHVIKVFGNDNLPGASCSFTYSSTLVAALNKCVAAGANVVSMSLGGPLPSFTERRAFARANRQGVLSIAAAGNNGNTRKSFPAGYPAVLSVAAVDADETVAAFSQKNKDVELSAPGVSVLSSVPWRNDQSLTADGITWSGRRMDGARETTGVSGPLVDGGLCLAPGAWAGQVVLCQRGGPPDASATFAAKVAAVSAGGGVAAVIYNNAAVDPPCGDINGTLGGAAATVPAIALTCAQGAEALTHAGASGQVVSTVTRPGSGYEAWNGTSMATPHVSAVAALVWSCHPSLSNNAIRGALTATARDLGDPGRDDAYGFGLVQAKAALLSLGPSATCTLH